MNFNEHSNLNGLHAPFSPSQPAWLRYDDNKIREVYRNKQAVLMGTRLHQWAAETIQLGIKQQRSNRTICNYVNDAIGFRMTPEQVLYFSPRFFGTADAITFKNGMLRIHDLKTGKNPAHMEQLEIYSALYCLEYGVKPADINIELRMYQNDEVIVHNPCGDEILPIMDKIVHFDKLLAQVDYEEA